MCIYISAHRIYTSPRACDTMNPDGPQGMPRHTILLNDVRSTLLQHRHVCQDGHNLENGIEKLWNRHAHFPWYLLSEGRSAGGWRASFLRKLFPSLWLPTVHLSILPCTSVHLSSVHLSIHPRYCPLFSWAPATQMYPVDNSLTLDEVEALLFECRNPFSLTPKM